MRTKIGAFLSALIFCVSLSATASAGYFSDVPDDAYYAAAVAWAIERGVTNGTTGTKFSPEQTCTQAEILTFLWRSENKPEPAISNPFTDVASGDYYCKAATWAYEKGMVAGSLFEANIPCTRSMTVTYLWKLSGSPSVSSGIFSDVPASAYYAQAVDWAVNCGITSGTSATTFSPNSICTRGQIVTFLYRFSMVQAGADIPTQNGTPDKAASVAGYSEYPTVPDFGVFWNISTALVYRDGTSTVYLYALSDLTNIGLNVLKDYSDYLLEQGFEYKGSFEGPSGDVMNFSDGNTTVSFGLMDDRFAVMVTS